MQERNAILEASVNALHKDKKNIETRARKELGMIKKGEVYYQVVS